MKHVIAALILCLAPTSVISEELTLSTSTALGVQLQELAATAATRTPPEVKAAMERDLERLRASNVEETALKAGQAMPAFALPNGRGQIVSSRALLKKGPLIVVFYRGGWCPYCNLQLRDLQRSLPDIQALGGTLVAISPQTPEFSLDTENKAELTYPVLSDVGLLTARKFGLVFQFTEEMKDVYRKFGLNLAATNGDADWRLPIAATYVVGKDGRITWSSVDADYRKRPDTADVIAALRAAAASH